MKWRRRNKKAGSPKTPHPEDIANSGYLDDLIAYIEYRRDMIPCYALRKKTSLKNSSNSSELCNESWSANGRR